jgi:hypothetical protein
MMVGIKPNSQKQPYIRLMIPLTRVITAMASHQAWFRNGCLKYLLDRFVVMTVEMTGFELDQELSDQPSGWISFDGMFISLAGFSRL